MRECAFQEDNSRHKKKLPLCLFHSEKFSKKLHLLSWIGCLTSQLTIFQSYM